jgi:transposase
MASRASSSRPGWLTPYHEHIRSWLQGLPGPIAVAYEAGPPGFGLYGALTVAGFRCEVVAPSKLRRPGGDRVKTDAKDPVHLARLLRMDEITAVAVPLSSRRPPARPSRLVAPLAQPSGAGVSQVLGPDDCNF